MEPGRVFADNSNVFWKLCSATFDAWCFSDEFGVIHSSTPQLDILLLPDGHGTLKGLPLLSLATTSQERKRAESFLHSIAKSELPGKITLALNRGSSAHQMEVILTAIAVTQAQMDCALDPDAWLVRGAAEGAEDSMGETRLFVAVQVIEAEPLCAVVGPNSEELPPTPKRVRWDTEVEVLEIDEVDKPSTIDVDLDSASAVGAPALPTLPEGATAPGALRVRNTFLETIESDTESTFCRVPSLGRRSAPAGLSAAAGGASCASPSAKRPLPMSRTPSFVHTARSVVSVRTATSKASRASGRSRASCLSQATSAWASSAPSATSNDPAEFVLTAQLQDRGLARVRVAARLEPVLALRKQGLRSLGSCAHATGQCYPCLMQLWHHEGKAMAPCKFGEFCGRCHEDHSEEQLTELRRKTRQRGKPKKARRAA